MNIQQFFDSPAMQLPRDRDNEDFERYLGHIFDAYIREVRQLDSGCHLCARIQGTEQDIAQLGARIQQAVRIYLGGRPQAAYNELVNGIDFVYSRLQTLLSRNVGAGEVGRLYRVTNTHGDTVTKERLFHVPFEFRHIVGQHRYGIPGFPCLYLGGSLALCIEECRLQQADVPEISVAEFGLRNTAKVLDFGYRPSALAQIAGGRAMGLADAKPPLEQFIVNYATCWPLIAASSIRVSHEGEAFLHEYIVPQMMLQWIMSNDECDGIRYFSTRFIPGPEAVHATANFVFPATHGAGPQRGHSQRLKDAFELTDPVLWGTVTSSPWFQETLNKEQHLNSLPKAPIP